MSDDGHNWPVLPFGGITTGELPLFNITGGCYKIIRKLTQ